MHRKWTLKVRPTGPTEKVSEIFGLRKRNLIHLQILLLIKWSSWSWRQKAKDCLFIMTSCGEVNRMKRKKKKRTNMSSNWKQTLVNYRPMQSSCLRGLAFGFEDPQGHHLEVLALASDGQVLALALKKSSRPWPRSKAKAKTFLILREHFQITDADFVWRYRTMCSATDEC